MRLLKLIEASLAPILNRQRRLLPGLLLCVALISGCTARVHTGTVDSTSATPSSQAAPPPEAEADPRWFQCRTDTDCVVEHGLCEQPAAVNRRFRKDYRRFADYWNPTLQCIAPPAWPHAPQARCVKNRCTTPSVRNR